MDMSGERRIAANPQAVWEALNDVSVLRQCIPGCEALEQVTPTDMATLGAVTGLLLGVATLAILTPARAIMRIDPVIVLRAEG